MSWNTPEPPHFLEYLFAGAFLVVYVVVIVLVIFLITII